MFQTDQHDHPRNGRPNKPPTPPRKKKKKQKKEEKDWVSHSAYRNNNILFLTLAGSISAYRIYDYKNR